MATGIHTSVPRGRRSQLSAKPTKETPWTKAVSILSGMSSKARYGLVGAVLLIVIGVSWQTYSIQTNQFGALYPLKLNSEDVSDISTILIRHGIEHTVPPTMDGIELHPQDKLRARALLAGHSLPRRIVESPEPDSTMPTSDMRRATEIRRLESELVYTLRQMEGVNDARVKLAIPRKTYFQDDNRAVKASVFLDLSGGYSIKPEVAKGVASLVSYSVPELQADNVILLDPDGKAIEVAVEGPQTLAQREEDLQRKLQLALSRVFGNRVHAVVNIEYDTSQEERRRSTPGGPKHDGYLKSGEQFFEEMLTGETEEDAKNYGTVKKAVNYVYAENALVSVRMEPKINRLTATVLVDGASRDEVAEVREMVKGAIGIDESRADEVVVSGLPWIRDDLWQPNPAPLPVIETTGTNSGPLLEALALGLGMFLLGIVGAGFLNRRTKPLFGLPMATTKNENMTTIVDHNQQKNGQFTTTGTTSSNSGRMEVLENLVNSRPEKVATLLRSTWLSH
jgi:flagellar biosynthesis/type III secretory pathway M-ring protein FliF/YscJ